GLHDRASRAGRVPAPQRSRHAARALRQRRRAAARRAGPRTRLRHVPDVRGHARAQTRLDADLQGVRRHSRDHPRRGALGARRAGGGRPAGQLPPVGAQGVLRLCSTGRGSTMTLTRRGPRGLARARSLLNTLIELPDLASTVQALPAPTFAALVRKVGIEDAGELVALATTEQLVQAFDEDLFVSARPGERESLDVERFVVWLEVLLETGDEVAADRVAELDEDFVAHALGGVLLVLDEEALRERLTDGDEDEAWRVDKSLESALTEDLDGYLLIAKQHDGWDAVLAL